MTLLLLALPDNEQLTTALGVALNQTSSGIVDAGHCTLRRFPDGESYVRVDTPLQGRDVAIVCTLHRPDEKILPVLFLAATARDVGAARIGLIAPYLAYMRQDRRFVDGEGVTSTYFARLLSTAFDWLVTVDPHLHRRSALADLYTIDTRVIHAAPRMAAWIQAHVAQPVLIGPDSESIQWVRTVAERADAPFTVLTKERHGDRDVEVSLPNVAQWSHHTPVLVDDIISTAQTMLAAARHFREAGLAPPICVGVHAVFADHAADDLAGVAARVVTCNTIPHPTNAIDVVPDLAAAVQSFTQPTAPSTAPASVSPERVG